MSQTASPRVVLHVGCGRKPLDSRFPASQWREIRLDINPAVKPDVVASITDMKPVATSSVDAVWSSHNVEHLFAHEVPLALGEFLRVLKPDGFLLITMPDLQEIARHVADGKLEETLYESPAGPVSPIDILYGHRPSIARGDVYMAHKTGFTAATLLQKLGDAGFRDAEVQVDRPSFSLWAKAFK